ncbi:MAG: D-2-hydroxyacid dehydrogenase, partial [Dehalococcoidia bacterium]
VLHTISFGEGFRAKIQSVDRSLRLHEATEPLRQLLRGELPEAPAVVAAAERDAAALLPAAEVIIGWARFPVDALRWAGRLRWIQGIGAGVERMDPRVAERITLTNGSGIAAEPIAEHVICLLLMLARGAQIHVRHQVEHRWQRDVPAREIGGMTMGIVGMGAIGSAVARRARALGLRVLAVRRSVERRSPDAVADEVCPPSDLPYLLTESDVVVLATPLTPETRGMIGGRELRAMRPGSYIINVSRGGVVDEPALIAALAGGHLGGAGLDVFATEPLPADSALWDMPNVIVTPHASYGSDRYMERMEALICDNLRRYLDGRPLRNVVDMERGY